jgi:hypothetical protein
MGQNSLTSVGNLPKYIEFNNLSDMMGVSETINPHRLEKALAAGMESRE